MAMLSTKNKFQCEKELLDGLLDRSKFLEEKSISANATSIIELCRKNKSDRTMLDAFLNEYGLDNNLILGEIVSDGVKSPLLSKSGVIDKNRVSASLPLNTSCNSLVVVLCCV